MIPVTIPYLPPKKKYDKYVNEIWHRNWLTNNGPLVNELELKLKELLKIRHLLFVTNGTIAIQVAIKALGLQNEIITTPFSYVATTSSLVWEGCEPIFVDIDENTLNIDPTKIEKSITSKTSAILATHVYGNPCDVEVIEGIANKNGLKVIYDAAHAFGVNYKGRSIFEYGDISTTSFHATKIFHTIEGGAVITNDSNLHKRMASMRNFGHAGPEVFDGIGINGKNSEFHAAMGLSIFDHLDEIFTQRKALSLYYDTCLEQLDKRRPLLFDEENYNYAYYPIIFPSEEILLKSKKDLEKNKIFSRRYFYPTLSSLSYVKKQETPFADNIAKRILCLPLYHTLNKMDIEIIAQILLKSQKS